jgi:putative phosphoribosyl transferase
MDDLKNVADRIIISHVIEKFFGVGQLYKRFDQVSDIDVKEIMKKYGYNMI